MRQSLYALQLYVKCIYVQYCMARICEGMHALFAVRAREEVTLCAPPAVSKRAGLGRTTWMMGCATWVLGRTENSLWCGQAYK